MNQPSLQSLAPSPALYLHEGEHWKMRRESQFLPPHSLVQYCDYSRHLSDRYECKPTYLGYAVLPRSHVGVCL